MNRLLTAFAAYLILAAISVWLLHGTPLYAVLGLFAFFALKSLIAHKMSQANTPAETAPEAVIMSLKQEPDSSGLAEFNPEDDRH